MPEEIKKGEFTSKYSIGEIVELKRAASCLEARSFSGEIRAVTFAANDEPAYLVRHWDGRLLPFQESELCILGVDFADGIVDA